MQDFSYLLSDPSVDRWLRFKAELTKKLYCFTLDHFISDFVGPEFGLKDPSSIVSWAKASDSLQVQDTIEKFGETQPRVAQLVRMSMIRSFLKKNGVTLPSGSSVRQYQKGFHRGYRRDEIQSLLGYLDSPLQKLYVQIAKDSGLRAQDVLSLRYRHIKKDLEANLEYVHIRLEPEYYNRKKASGLTFLGPDSIKLLKQLISAKVISMAMDSKIFPFTYITITQSLAIAKKKAGLEGEIQPSHGLRKFFENCLDRVGMDVHKKLQLEGHSQGVRVHYTDRNVEDLRKLYAEAYQFLGMSEETAADSRFKELEKSLAEKTQHIESLKAEIAKSKERDLEIEEIRKELRRQREKLEELAKE